jgi:hypothetical protein
VRAPLLSKNSEEKEGELNATALLNLAKYVPEILEFFIEA